MPLILRRFLFSFFAIDAKHRRAFADDSQVRVGAALRDFAHPALVNFSHSGK
jgi:hypothetical protein